MKSFSMRVTVSRDPQAFLQPIGHSNQELISDHVAQAVVDHLEAVEVQKQDRKEIILMAFRMFDQSHQPIKKQQPIRQARQRIGDFLLR